MKPQERTRLILASGLSCEAKMIAIVISDHMDEDDRNSFPSTPLIAEQAGLCERTVQERVKRGKADGWLVRDEHPGMQRQAWAIRWDRLPPQEMRPRRGCAPAGDAGVPPQGMHPTPAGHAPDPRRACGRSDHDPTMIRPVIQAAVARATTPATPPPPPPVSDLGGIQSLKVSLEPPATSEGTARPIWLLQILEALRGVGCSIDGSLPEWILGRVPPSEASKASDWLVDAASQGKVYTSPRSFLNSWMSKVKADEQRSESPNTAPKQPVRGDFQGGRELPPADRERAERALQKLQERRKQASGATSV